MSKELEKLEEVERNLTNIVREYTDKLINEEEVPEKQAAYYMGIDYALIQIRHAIDDLRGIND